MASDAPRPARARAFAEKYGGHAYESLAALLADPAIELVVNLTIHFAHYEVVKQCLLAGKHVFLEKPIALELAEADELIALVDERRELLDVERVGATLDRVGLAEDLDVDEAGLVRHCGIIGSRGAPRASRCARGSPRSPGVLPS